MAARAERIVGGVIVLMASRLAKLLVGWGIEVTLVRVLLPEVWDSVAKLLTVSLSVTLVGQFGFPESVLNFGGRAASAQEAKVVLHRASALLLGVSLLIGAAFLPFDGLRERTLGSADVSVLMWFTLFVASELAAAPMPSFLIARRFVRAAGIYSVVARVPNIVCVLIALVLDPSVRGVIMGMGAGSFVSAGVGLWLVEHLAPGRVAEPQELGLMRQLSFAAPVGLSRIAQIINGQLDKLVIMAALPGAAFGTYYLGAVEMPLVFALCQATTSVMMPDLVEAARSDRARLLQLIHTSMSKLALFALPTFSFCMVFAELIFTVVYGAEQVNAAIPFRIFQLLLLHRLSAYTLLLQSIDRPRVPLIAALITLVINAPLSYVLTRSFGLIGAPVATVTAVYLSAIYFYWEMKRALGVGVRDLLPWRPYAMTFLAAAIAALPSSALARVMPAHGATLVACAIVHLITFIVLARAMGVLSANDIRVLKNSHRAHRTP